MVTKNQEFKEKMLKKSHIEIGSGSENNLDSNDKRNSRATIFCNENQEDWNDFSKLKFDSENDGLVLFPSNFGTSEKKETFGNLKAQSDSP